MNDSRVSPLRLVAQVAATVSIMGAVACGGEAKPPAASGLPLTFPSATAAAPEPEPEPSAEPSAVPSASAAAEAPPTPPPSSGRIAVIKSDEKSITDTFGSAPAKLELGETDKAVLRIPENALDRAYNITFAIEPKGKSHGAPAGKIYRTRAQIGTSASYSTAVSSGPPFSLELPAVRIKNPNLAVGTITTDDKGHEKIEWTVIAPKRVDEELGVAYFDLPSLTDAYLHVTTRPAP
jgi:hypothetical protein